MESSSSGRVGGTYVTLGPAGRNRYCLCCQNGSSFIKVLLISLIFNSSVTYFHLRLHPYYLYLPLYQTQMSTTVWTVSNPNWMAKIINLKKKKTKQTNQELYTLTLSKELLIFSPIACNNKLNINTWNNESCKNVKWMLIYLLQSLLYHLRHHLKHQTINDLLFTFQIKIGLLK